MFSCVSCLIKRGTHAAVVELPPPSQVEGCNAAALTLSGCNKDKHKMRIRGYGEWLWRDMFSSARVRWSGAKPRTNERETMSEKRKTTKERTTSVREAVARMV